MYREYCKCNNPRTQIFSNYITYFYSKVPLEETLHISTQSIVIISVHFKIRVHINKPKLLTCLTAVVFRETHNS